MTLRTLLSLAVIAATGCSAFEPAGQVQGTIDGVVTLTAPIGGVIVTAYPYAPDTGTPGAEIAHSDPSGPDGAFHLDLGIYFGPLVLIGRGAGATYTEPSTTTQVTWDAAQSLHLAWVAPADTGALRLDYQRGDQQHDVVIGPWSELAYTLGVAKRASAPDGLFSTALESSTLLLRDHLEVEYWSTPPVDLTAGDARTWQAPVQAALEGAGFSQLVTRMATESATSGISAVDLLRALDRDAGDGLFDGRGPDGALTLGTCKVECRLSSQTLRSHLADSMGLFLGSAQNHSTIDAKAVNDFLVRIATRRSDLFPDDGMDNYDVTPPTIDVVESSVIDEGAGGASVPLTTGTTAMFSRFVDDYGPSSPGIPRWRFLVADDRTADDQIAFEARLVRTMDMAELVPWFLVPVTVASGFNREVVVSSALDADVATQSGGYQLELRARDAKQNQSPVTTVRWQQTVLPAAAPAVSIVDNSATDESPIAASVDDAGLPAYSGVPAVVTLSGTTMPVFARYSSHYGASDSGIPRWHFLATSNHPPVSVQARLIRTTDQIELLPWFDVPEATGSGYNREIVVSSGLHQDIANLSGTYQLEVKATDSNGVVSAVSVAAWQQTVLAPPIRQRAAPTCNVGNDGQCPGHYSLQGSLDADVPINGAALPGGVLRIGHLYIDNPNPVPVRVNVGASASLAWNRGRRNWINPIVNQVPYTAGCKPAQNLDGSCYAFTAPNVEDVASAQTVSSPTIGVQVLMGGVDLGACGGCGISEREFPPGVTADVWIVTTPYSFLWSGYPLSKLTNPNLPATAIGSQAETWFTWVQNAFPLFHQTWWYLTRLSVVPTVTTSLQSRPPDSRAKLVPAIGTNTASFAATPSIWNTHAPSEGSF